MSSTFHASSSPPLLFGKVNRSIPCDGCRKHRRKCLVLDGVRCERCKELWLPCLFKLIPKPARPSKSERAALDRVTSPELTKDQALELIQSLESQARRLEKQILQRRRERARHCFKVSRQRLTIRIDALPVRNMADLVHFLQNMGQPFIDRPMRTPSYFCRPWDLPVMLKTHGMMAIHFKDFIFKQASRCTNRLTAAPPRFIPPPPGDDLYHQTIQAAKLSLIRLYFDCGHSLHPALVRSHYEPYLLAHPDCMVANALAALKAIGTCYHNARLDLPMPFSQTALEALSSCRINDARDLPNEFAEQHYAKARMQLEDVLFDEDPDLDTLITLWLLSCYSLSTSRYKQGRTYVALSWRVALQLQDRYLPHSPQKSGEGAEAETWKRLYYCIRNMQYSLEDALESSQNFRPVVLPSPIGLPTALPCEQNIPELHHAVNVFSHCVRLSVLPGGPHKTDKRETIEKYLEALSQTRVSSTDIKAIEDQLIEFWTCLPPEFRLTDTPMGFMDSGRLERQEPTAPVLHLNLMYYLGWLMLEARLMDDPSLVDLSHISLHGPIDGARALLVLAMSSDALSKIIHELHRKARCHFTAHWAALVIIMLKAVAHCSHKGIRTMAEQNTALLLQTLVDYPSIRKAFLV